MGSGRPEAGRPRHPYLRRGLQLSSERASLSELIGKAGQSVANATASGAASLIAGYDYGNLEMLAANVARQINVIRVTIRNRDGRIMAQSEVDDARTHQRFEAPVVFNGQTIGAVTVDVRPMHWNERWLRSIGVCLSNRPFLARYSG